MNIAEVLRARARELGARPAIIDRRGQTSFEELDRATARMAGEFEGAGVRPGDRTLVFHPMSMQLYVILIGLFRLGVTAVFADPAAGRRRIDRCCALAQPHAFVGSLAAHALRLVSSGVRSIPVKIIVGRPLPGTTSVAAGGGRRERETIEPCRPDTPALVTFTSGSTGEPKGAVRAHGFLLAQHHVLEQELHLQPGDVDLTTLPIFVLSNLASGVTSVIADADLTRPGAIRPAPVLEQIQVHRPTRVVASPALLERLAWYVRSCRTTLDSFRHIFTGGAPVFPRLLSTLREVAPQASVTAVYGSTEAEPMASVSLKDVSPEELAAMRGGAGLLAGRPVPAIDLRVIPDRWGRPIGPFSSADFDRDALPPGRIGEIVVAGDHVLRGYLGGVGDAETKFRVDSRVWHRTGDAGYQDDRGRLWLMGRCSARINDEAGTVYPFAVECAAQESAGVRRAALVARRQQRLLVVELAPDAEAGVKDRLLEALQWAGLAGVTAVRAIPVDSRHNAKIDYPKLRKMLDRL